MYSCDGWARVAELREGDRVATPRRIPGSDAELLDNDELRHENRAGGHEAQDAAGRPDHAAVGEDPDSRHRGEQQPEQLGYPARGAAVPVTRPARRVEVPADRQRAQLGADHRQVGQIVGQPGVLDQFDRGSGDLRAERGVLPQG